MNWDLIIIAVIAAVPGVIAAVAAIIAAMKVHTVSQGVAVVSQDVKVVTKQMDGMKDQLVASTAKASRAEGVLAGKKGKSK